MRVQERIYRVLLLAYPRSHRREYGEAMVQLMRDRVRDDGGGLRFVVVWWSLLVDLARSATIERTAVVRGEFRAGWWRTAAVIVAMVLVWVDIDAFAHPEPGPWYGHVFGAVLLVAPVAILAGLVMRTRRPRHGSLLVAVGVLPGTAAIILFWFPPFLLFGLLSIAVMVAAISDADDARRAAFAAAGSRGAGLPGTAWSPPSEGGRDDVA